MDIRFVLVLHFTDHWHLQRRLCYCALGWIACAHDLREMRSASPIICLFLFISLRLYPSVCLSVCLSVSLTVCLYVCLSVCM